VTQTHSVLLLWTRDRVAARTALMNNISIHKRQTYMPPAPFDFAIPARERLQTYVTDRAVAEKVIFTFPRV
jgi:hypothetical protein